MLTSRTAELEKRNRIAQKGIDGGSFIPRILEIKGKLSLTDEKIDDTGFYAVDSSADYYQIQNLTETVYDSGITIRVTDNDGGSSPIGTYTTVGAGEDIEAINSGGTNGFIKLDDGAFGASFVASIDYHVSTMAIYLPSYINIENFLGAFFNFKKDIPGDGNEWYVLGDFSTTSYEYDFKYNQEDNKIVIFAINAALRGKPYILTVFYKG